VLIDNEPPKFLLCPANIVANVAANTCGAVVNYAAPTATDNCAGAIVPALVSGPATASGATFPVGTTTVVFTATSGGLSSTCTFTVKVNDNQLPTIACTNPQSACTGSFLPLTVPGVTVLDNCPAPLVTPVTPAGFNGFVTAGSSSITLSATDASGNTAAVPCTFTLTGIAENQACGANRKCIAANCVASCIAAVNLVGCPGTDNFAYEYAVGQKVCTRIEKDTTDLRYVFIGPWTTVPNDAVLQPIVAPFTGKFKMTTSPLVRTFTQVSGGTRSIELKTPAGPIVATSVCSLKFFVADRKRLPSPPPKVLGGGASLFPNPLPAAPI
jgi:hypothetical protein